MIHFSIGNSKRDSCDSLRFPIQENERGNHSDNKDEKVVAMFDKLLDYTCFTPAEHKNVLMNTNLV